MNKEWSKKSEAARIDALRRREILDTAPDAALDVLTALAARSLRVPVALITLVDSDRIWFKSRVGLEMIQIARAPGLCSSAILGDTPYVVADAAADPRTSGNPLVAGGLGLRFYAAAPLRTYDGYKLGTLCVLDREPREFGASDLRILETLAGLVMERMDSRFATRQLRERNQALAARVGDLETLHEARERLAASAAHDLRNSLGASMLMARLLLEEKFGPLNERQRQMIETICGASDEMLRLVKEGFEQGELPETRHRAEG